MTQVLIEGSRLIGGKHTEIKKRTHSTSETNGKRVTGEHIIRTKVPMEQIILGRRNDTTFYYGENYYWKKYEDTHRKSHLTIAQVLLGTLLIDRWMKQSEHMKRLWKLGTITIKSLYDRRVTYSRTLHKNSNETTISQR